MGGFFVTVAVRNSIARVGISRLRCCAQASARKLCMAVAVFYLIVAGLLARRIACRYPMRHWFPAELALESSPA